MATTASPLTLDRFVTRIHAHGLDEASEQLGPFINIRYVQLERGMACSRGSAARLEQMTIGYVSADRHKLEWLEVPRGRMLIVVPTRGRARLGTTCIGRGRAIVAHGPTELTLCTDRDYQSSFVSMPDCGIGEFIAQDYSVTGSVRVRMLHAPESTIETLSAVLDSSLQGRTPRYKRCLRSAARGYAKSAMTTKLSRHRPQGARPRSERGNTSMSIWIAR